MTTPERNTQYDRKNTVRTTAPLVTALVIGGLVGAGAMMLLAPKSGKDTRKTIQKGTRQLRDRTVGGVMGAFKQVTSRGHDLKDGVMERADGLQQHSRNMIAHELDNVAEAAKRAKKAVKG